MGNFIQGIQTLFSGPDTSGQDAQIASAKQDQTIAFARQTQDLQNTQAEQDRQAGLVSRVPRGRRLLQAATGDSGVQQTLG